METNFSCPPVTQLHSCSGEIGLLSSVSD